MSTFLRLRNGHYYLRVRVPNDLLDITSSPEILKSLHTRNLQTAIAIAAVLRPQLLQIFSLSRFGLIPPDQAREGLARLFNRKSKLRSLPGSQGLPHPPTLQKIIYQYVTEHKVSWTAKTCLEYESYFRLIQEVLYIDKLSEITRSEIRRLRDTLCKLPANRYKKYPQMSIQQILDLDCITPMSTTTVNKLLTLFGGVMRHCIKEGYLTDNPVEGCKLKRKRRADEERKIYSEYDLKAIVTVLPSPTDKPDKYWIPMIGMYSGMRMGEICGLHLEDIKNIDGVWCFDVNDEDEKRLKNIFSRRFIPVHPQLIKHGLLELVQSLKNRGEKRLWPNLVKRDIDGYCHSFGNWFGRLNRQKVTSDPLKTFHSLRHTFANQLKQGGVQECLIAELMGHANSSITTGRYGKRYMLGTLLEGVKKVSYRL